MNERGGTTWDSGRRDGRGGEGTVLHFGTFGLTSRHIQKFCFV